MRGSIPDLAATISEIGDLLLPSHDMAEMVPGLFAPGRFALRALKRRKFSKQLTNQPMTTGKKKKPGRKDHKLKNLIPQRPFT